MTEDQLSSLLRTIKRHEQPPPGYFDQLLRNVHRRQRSELLRLPLWRIALERMQTLFGEHSMGPVSYASSMAAVVVIGITAIGLLTPRKVEQHKDVAVVQETKLAPPSLTLQSPAPTSTGSQPSLFPVNASTTTVIQPHYILDTRPPSHEAKLFGL